MSMFRVIIAGGRDFENYTLLQSKMEHYLQNHGKSELVIITGGADGADSLGERYAHDLGYILDVYPAKWKEYGKSAGPIRNRQMAESADALVAFWDGKSRGTKNMIDFARKLGLRIRIVKYTRE